MLFAYVLIPNFRIFRYEASEKIFTFCVVEIDDVYAVLAEPIESALECFRFTENDGPNSKLTD